VNTPDTPATTPEAPASRAARAAGPLARLRRWTPAILVANLVGQIGIIVTGGAVRLTGSGLGCSTWPECEPGRFTPAFHEATSLHPYIEFGNRTLTGVLGLIALAVFLVMFSDTTRTLRYRLLGLVPGVGVITQAVIGGVVVLLDLHPGWVSLHFGVSGALVALKTVGLVSHGSYVLTGVRPAAAAGAQAAAISFGKNMEIFEEAIELLHA
jgi:cytochrome c oxidase assembly protein subunit 15